MRKPKKMTSPLLCYKKNEINELKWANRRNDTWTWRIEMGCSFIERDLETSQVRNFGERIRGTSSWEQETTRTNTGWNSTEQEMAKKNQWHWIHQRTGHYNNGHGQPSSHQADERQFVCFSIVLYIFSMWWCFSIVLYIFSMWWSAYPDISMTGQDVEWSEPVLVRTHSKRGTKEEIGWSHGWWYRTSQHSTRCTEKRVESKRPTDRLKGPRNKQITHCSREDTWHTVKLLKPTTWPTWAPTKDVSWQHSWSMHKKEWSPRCKQQQATTDYYGKSPCTDRSKRW